MKPCNLLQGFFVYININQNTMANYDKLKEKHEKLRNILIENGCEEHGDCIIDEICELFGEEPTTVYYEEE